MFNKSNDLPQNKASLKVKQNDKFFSRLLTKENSVANPSFRVYYGGVSGAVPFMWESQPGTPKHYAFSDTSLPPLTPPPSYYSKSYSKPIKKHSRSGLWHALFPQMISLKKTNLVPPSASSSSLFSSSWSSSPVFAATSPGKYQRKSRFSTLGSSFDSTTDAEETAAIGSPTSTLCLAIGRGVSVSVVDAMAGDNNASASAFHHGSGQDVDLQDEIVDLLCNHLGI